jgi:hypothetical protein
MFEQFAASVMMAATLYGLKLLRAIQRDLGRHVRSTARRFADTDERIEECEDRLDDHDDQFAALQPKEDNHGTEAQDGHAAAG